MRVLELIPSLSPGGAERFVVDLSNAKIRNKYIPLHIRLDVTRAGTELTFVFIHVSIRRLRAVDAIMQIRGFIIQLKISGLIRVTQKSLVILKVALMISVK